MNTAKAEVAAASFARSVAQSLFAVWLTLLPLSLLVWSRTGANAVASTQREADVRTLRLGEPIERELASQQQHSYKITLRKNQFMKVAVAQRGMDVVVTAIDPDGKKIGRVSQMMMASI